MGVDYFFLLSGFGLYCAYSNHTINQNGFQFAIGKVKKIYLLYMFSMLCMVPYSIIMDMKDAPLKTAVYKAVIKLFGGVTLLQAGIGSSYTSRALNAPCWFLSCLFMIYMICPILLKITKRIATVRYHAIIIMIAILFLAVASIITSSVESHLNYINELFYGSPYVRWLYVFIGMQIAAVVTKRYFTTGLMNVMEIICAVCVGFWFVYRNIVGAPLVILRLADIILCAVCLFVFSIGGGPISRMLSNDKFLLAGKISSYIFIVHFVVICYVDLLFEKNRYVVGQWTGVLELLIIIGLIYIIIRSICWLEKIDG